VLEKVKGGLAVAHSAIRPTCPEANVDSSPPNLDPFIAKSIDMKVIK
jgi:ribosomal protein S1